MNLTLTQNFVLFSLGQIMATDHVCENEEQKQTQEKDETVGDGKNEAKVNCIEVDLFKGAKGP